MLHVLKNKESEEALDELFQYIEDKNLHNLLPRVKYYLEQLAAQRDEYHRLVIISRDDLADELVNDIVKIVGADKDDELLLIKDKSLIGGWQAIYQGSLYDASAVSAVRQLHTRLST
jgi:F0F1-type ATP synthase delta subunit